MKKFFSPAVLSILSLTAIAIAQSIFTTSANERVKRMAIEAARAQEMSQKSLALSQMLLKQRDKLAEKNGKAIFLMTMFGYSQGQQGVPTELFLTNAAQMMKDLQTATNLDFTIELQHRSLTNTARVKKWL